MDVHCRLFNQAIYPIPHRVVREVNTIATGYLQIQVQDTISKIPLSNVSVRIFKIENTQVVFEDFFISDASGKTLPIPLYVPSTIEPACYSLLLKAPQYVQTEIRNIQIFNNVTTLVSQSIVLATARAINIITCPNMQPLQIPSTPYFIDYKTLLEKSFAFRIPNYITLLVATPQKVETLVVPFIDFLTNVMCSVLLPTWPQNILKVHILRIQSLIYHEILKHWKNEQSPFELCIPLPFSLSYNIHQPIYNNIKTLVERFYLACLASTSSSTSCVPLLKLAPYPIALHQRQQIFYIQSFLHTISLYYQSVCDVQMSGIFDEATHKSIQSFQQLLGIRVTSLLDKNTYRLLKSMVEELLAST